MLTDNMNTEDKYTAGMDTLLLPAFMQRGDITTIKEWITAKHDWPELQEGKQCTLIVQEI